MFVQAYGRFWDRELVDWDARRWQLLGRQGSPASNVDIADFRHARGIYVLYNDVGLYYVGISRDQGKGIGGRLRNHLSDRHGGLWTRFSWFSFDAPNGRRTAENVRTPEPAAKIEGESVFAITDIEALFQRAMAPFANWQETAFKAGEVEWIQVATRIPRVQHYDELKNRTNPAGTR